MEDGRIPKDFLYSEVALGRRTTGRPHLRYKDVCVRDMKAVDIDTMSWEGLAADRTKWRSEHSKTTPQDRRIQTDGCSSGQTSTQKGGQQLDPKPNIDVMCAIKTAIPTLVFSAISDAATIQQEIIKIKNKH